MSSAPFESAPKGLPDLNELSPAQLAEIAANCLSRLEVGRQPLPLFTQLARHAVISTVEFAPIHDKHSELGVIMTQRPDDDPWWPRQWHIPGSVLLPTDSMATPHDYSGPMERVFKSEFRDSITPLGSPTLFDIKRRSGPRGHELTAQTWIETRVHTRLPSDTRVFSISDLSEADPSLFIQGHGLTAQQAIDHYTSQP